MSLHVLTDGVAESINMIDEGQSLFSGSLDTGLSGVEYQQMVMFLAQCEDPRWSVSQKSALAQVSVNIRPNRKPFQKLKYRRNSHSDRQGHLSVPVTIALESVYAREHFAELLPMLLKGERVGRVFAYDKAAALTADKVNELYCLPEGSKTLSKTEVGLPMADLHYVIKHEDLEHPGEALMYALQGRRELHNVLKAQKGPMPALRPNDTLISAFNLESKVDCTPPTNIVLGIRTTRKDLHHLHAPLLDQGRFDAHHSSADREGMWFQVELTNHTGQTLSPEELKATLIRASFYKSVDPLQLHKAKLENVTAVV